MSESPAESERPGEYDVERVPGRTGTGSASAEPDDPDLAGSERAEAEGTREVSTSEEHGTTGTATRDASDLPEATRSDAEASGAGPATSEPASPEAGSSAAAAGEAASPEASDAAAPETTSSEAAAPKATSPEAAAPEATSSETAAPEAAAPEATASETAASEAGSSEAGAAQGASDAEASATPAGDESTAGRAKSLPKSLTFQLTRTSLLAVLVVAICVTPIAFAQPFPLLLPSYLIPLALAFAITRPRTVVTAEQVTSRGLIATTRFGWDELASVRLNESRWVRAVLTSGKEVVLPAIRVRDLSRLAELSGGRLPDPNAEPQRTEAEEAPAAEEATPETAPTPAETPKTDPDSA